MIRAHSKSYHELQLLWRGPLKVIDSKSSLVFTVEDITTQQHLVVHAQSIIPYTAARFGEQALRELKGQGVYYDSNYRLVDAIKGVPKSRNEYEMLLSWAGFKKREDGTWKALRRVMVDMPWILEDCLHLAGKKEFKAKNFRLIFLFQNLAWWWIIGAQ